ncbi:MAG: EutN/CcmL family microcompartment protein [Elusimicrobia bacterium]|jgi:ethanolamine utilization protein EutN|nr:EutN/CcmL family microcompartment protein [Elusimicrobiota bacterium]
MKVARVIGNAWATRKHPILEAKKLLIVEPIDETSAKPVGEPLLAIDSAGAGIGDIVLVLDEGSSCRLILGEDRGPARTIIVGIVDETYKNGIKSSYH